MNYSSSSLSFGETDVEEKSKKISLFNSGDDIKKMSITISLINFTNDTRSTRIVGTSRITGKVFSVKKKTYKTEKRSELLSSN